MIHLTDRCVLLMREIAMSPQDCHLNHKIVKADLRLLLAHGLVEVETRRMSPWFFEPDTPSFVDATERSRFWEEWGRLKRARLWQGRSEVHARLTDDGFAWFDEWKRLSREG